MRSRMSAILLLAAMTICPTEAALAANNFSCIDAAFSESFDKDVTDYVSNPARVNLSDGQKNSVESRIAAQIETRVADCGKANRWSGKAQRAAMNYLVQGIYQRAHAVDSTYQDAQLQPVHDLLFSAQSVGRREALRVTVVSTWNKSGWIALPPDYIPHLEEVIGTMDLPNITANVVNVRKWAMAKESRRITAEAFSKL